VIHSIVDEILTIMNFESLPNEILIACFEYLNGPDIFCAFDGLNYRFQMWIQTITLHVNFQHIRKSTLDHFCSKMLLNSTIKQHIYSLQLSNATVGWLKVIWPILGL